jgi:LppX_LprAFG lipoprotein
LAARIILVTVASLTLVACGGSGSHAASDSHAASKSTPPSSAATTKLDVAQLLQRSRATLDSTSAVHFQLSSSGVASHTTSLISGSGDLVRPDELRGSLLVSAAGIGATIKVISTGGRFYALLPFTSGYKATNPASYGLGNPAQLLSPTDGVSSLLTTMQSPRMGSSIRIDGELVDVVSGTVPGRKVPVLPNLDKAEPVSITAYISPATYQLRRVRLTGPFTKAKVATTYDVTITSYGEHVTISVPAST